MRKTEYKDWVNGYMRHGRNLHSFAISFHWYAIMICWGYKPGIFFYQLI